MQTSLLMLLIASCLTTAIAQEKTAEHFRAVRTGNSLEFSFMPIDDYGNQLASFVSILPPQFPGGFDSLARFYSRHLRYPESAIRDSVVGKVRVRFKIDKTGKVSDVQLEIGVRKDLDSACIRAISILPRWRPARYRNGTSVACQAIQPVRFVLDPKQSRTQERTIH